MMHFVLFFQPTQNGNRIFHARFTDQYFLETPLQSRIFFDILAVFIQRRRADAMQLTACQRRFEHIACVHCAFGLARADHSMNFIDKQNNLAFLFGQIRQHRLQALFKFTPVLGARQQRTHIQ